MDLQLALYEMGFRYPQDSDTSYPLFLQLRYALLTRGPRPIVNVGNLVRPFSTLVWALIFLSLVAAILFALLAFHVYFWLPNKQDLIVREVQPSLIALKMVASVTEPERIKLFGAWSTGCIVT